MKQLLTIIHFYTWGAMHSPMFPYFHIHIVFPVRVWGEWWHFSRTYEVNFQFNKPGIRWKYPLSVLDDYCEVYGQESLRDLIASARRF